MERFPKSLISFQRMFPDEARCQTNWIGSEEPANQASQAAS